MKEPKRTDLPNGFPSQEEVPRDAHEWHQCQILIDRLDPNCPGLLGGGKLIIPSSFLFASILTLSLQKGRVRIRRAYFLILFKYSPTLLLSTAGQGT